MVLMRQAQGCSSLLCSDYRFLGGIHVLEKLGDLYTTSDSHIPWGLALDHRWYWPEGDLRVRRKALA